MVKTVYSSFASDARKFKVESTGIKDGWGKIIWKEVGVDDGKYYTVETTGHHAYRRNQKTAAIELADDWVKKYINF